MKKYLVLFFWIFIFYSSISYSQPSQGLIGHWPFNGNANDLSGYGNTGTVYGATLTSDRFGNLNSAYYFSGSSNYIDCGNKITSFTNQMTVSAWIKTNTIADNVAYIVGKYGWLSSSEDAKGFQLLFAHLFVQLSARDQVYEYNMLTSGDLVLNNGNWHHAVGVINSSVYELWIDGVKISALNNNHSNVDLSERYNLYIGGHFNNGIDRNMYFTGAIDDVRLYNRALSASEISQLFNEKSFAVTTIANPTNGGTLIGSGTYVSGQTVTVQATANTGYTFLNWSENGNMISTNSTYSFAITSNKNLTANFSPSQYTITTSASPETGGIVSGAGVYSYGQNVTVTSSPCSGYGFINWTENGTAVSFSPSYSFTVTNNRNLVANFGLNQYTVTTTPNPIAGGTVTGAGIYLYGQNITVVATPNTGYSFSNWTENGNVLSSSSSYLFAVNGNKNLIANFIQNQYSVTTSSNPVAGGTLTGAGTYLYGQNVVVTATPNTGYGFVNWTENGNIVFTSPTYSFAITGNRNLTANFAIKQCTVIITPNPPNAGLTTGGGVYNYGESTTVVATPNNGFRFVNWTENNLIVSAASSYQFYVTADRNLTANFATIPTLSITPRYIQANCDSGKSSFNISNITGGAMPWIVKSNATWITILSSISGTNDGTVNFKYLANTGVSRTGIITITSDGSINSPSTFELYQDKFVSVEDVTSGIPTSFKLFQNYPNPFNPTTIIQFSIPQSSLVLLKIYNLLGQEVAELVNQELPASTYSINFDASKLKSGIYFYRIQAGNFSETRKLILLK